MITRLSKIARLPANIREELNRRLHNGELGKTILPWLNELPETKRVLAELFQGKPVTHQNLSEWRRAGYQDWFFLQHRLQWFDGLTEQETEIEKNQCGDAYETMGWHFLYEIGQALAQLQNIKDPERRCARLQNLTREFARLQNAFNWSRRVQLDFDKWNKPVNSPEPAQPAPVIEENHDTEEDDEYFEEADDNKIEEAEIDETADKKELENAFEYSGSPVLAEIPETVPTLGALASRRPFGSEQTIENSASPVLGSEGTIENSPAVYCRENDPTVQVPEGRLTEPPSTPKLLNSQPPLGAPDIYELARENANLKPTCQPIPPLAPTTPPSPQPRPHLSPVPIRGRRFICVEG